jgi:chromosome partitioning protein
MSSSCHSYAVINYKGGTGKTSTAIHIAHGLSLKGKRVLLIDTDPQGSISHYFGIKSDKTLFDLLIQQEPIQHCITNLRPNLDAILSNERIFPAEIKMAKENQREYILARALSALNGYDFVILDCAPSMNILNQNALVYAQKLLLPVSMEYLSLIGVKQLLKNIKIINKLFNKKVKISKVIPTFFDKRNKKSKDILESLKRVFPNIVSEPVGINVRMSEAPGKKMTIFEYDPNSSVAEDYLLIVEEMLNNV